MRNCFKLTSYWTRLRFDLNAKKVNTIYPKFTILKVAAEGLAQADDVSLNQFIVTAVVKKISTLNYTKRFKNNEQRSAC